MLTIVIPVYNEGDNIKNTVRKIEEKVKYPFKINLIYDSDDDTTLFAASNLNVNLIKNKYGKGALNAIKTGFETAGTEFIAVTMADLSDPPEVINHMVETMQKTDASIVCGSRYMKGGSQKGGPLIKGLLSRMAGLTLNKFAKIETCDATNSFKLYRKSFLEKVTIESTGGFELGLELVIKAHKMGCKVTEVPTSWRDREFGKSNFKLFKWLPCYLKWYFSAFLKKNTFNIDYKKILICILFFLFAIYGFHFVACKEVNTLDNFWTWALSAIHMDKNCIFGKDVVFTYGPFGYLIHPSIVKKVLAEAFLFKIATIGAYLFCLFNFINKKRFLPFMAILTLNYCLELGFYEFLAPLLAFCFLDLKGRKKLFTLILFSTFSIFSIFTKFSIGILYCTTLFMTLLIEKFNKKYLFYTAGIFLAGATSVIALHFKNTENFINWFKYTFSIASGYSEAMSSYPCPGQFAAYIAAGIIFILFCTLFKKGNWKLFFVLLPSAFLMFKATFVRIDYGHSTFFFKYFLSLVPLLYLFIEKISIKKLCVIYFICFYFLISFISFGSMFNFFNMIKKEDMYYTPKIYHFENLKQSVVEFIPNGFNHINKYDIKQHFSPTIQAYSAYTKELDDFSAKNYQNQNPEYIIINNIENIDKRNLIFDMPNTFDAIKENYKLIKKEKDYIILEKKETKEYDYVIFKTDEYSFKQGIIVPEKAVKAKIHAELSLLGKIMKVIYRIPPMQIGIMADKIENYRIIRQAAINGINMNLINSMDDLSLWLEDIQGDNAIKAFYMETSMPQLYKEKIKIEWLMIQDNDK